MIDKSIDFNFLFNQLNKMYLLMSLPIYYSISILTPLILLIQIIILMNYQNLINFKIKLKKEVAVVKQD